MSEQSTANQCSAEGTILKPCPVLRDHMTGPYRPKVGGRGVFLMTLNDVRTGKPTRSCAILRGPDGKEIGLNFCPFCGRDIQSQFTEKSAA